MSTPTETPLADQDELYRVKYLTQLLVKLLVTHSIVPSDIPAELQSHLHLASFLTCELENAVDDVLGRHLGESVTQ